MAEDGPTVFEDLTEGEQKEILSSYTKDEVDKLALILAETLRRVGEDFDIKASHLH